MTTRLTLQLRRAMYNLRGGFLVRPLSIALTLGCTGALLSWLEETTGNSGADPQVAQIILAGIAASIMTVVSIVFAIMLMTLTLASMQFSPRIIVSFVQDRVTQWTLGIFLGTFLFCMAALPSAHLLPQPFAPVFAVRGAMLLAIVCVGWLLFFIHHITRAISASHIVDRIAAETIGVIDQTMPWPHRPETRPETPAAADNWEAVVPSEVSGYIRYIDQKRLVEVAKAHRLQIKVLRRVGHFVPAGVPLMMVSKAGRLTAEVGHELRGVFDFGPTRTLQQDVEFGILQIVDIALKAISPAVNDPSTAISSVDHLSRILIRCASRESPAQVLYDPPGTARVVIPWLGFERLLESAFEQIRLYSKSDVAVSMRLLRALGDIAVTTQDPDYRRILAERAERVVAGCAERLGDTELGAVRARFDTLNFVD